MIRDHETIAEHAQRPHPHEGGCELCYATRHCNACGKSMSWAPGRWAGCTNGRCVPCHRTTCTPGGVTGPGHGYGAQGPTASEYAKQQA